MSLYTKYDPALPFVIRAFYAKIQSHDQVQHFFANTDMHALIEHQIKFFSQLMGGPNNYTGRSLLEAHADLDITEAHFAVIAQLLQETLQEFNVDEADVAQILAAAAAAKPQIVNS